MTEIFADIRDEVKEAAAEAWKNTLMQENVVQAAHYLNNITEEYRKIYTPEEMDFLQFYFQMKMEMMKE